MPKALIVCLYLLVRLQLFLPLLMIPSLNQSRDHKFPFNYLTFIMFLHTVKGQINYPDDRIDNQNFELVDIPW
ncbi:hypothetical protein CBF18_17270 [Mastigocladus laminosus WC112]|nr:hypothetical protein CBF18_17270 [Mastigocladus laminosus WC112]